MLIIAAVVFLAGVALWIVLPRWDRSVREARALETVEQLREFARAFQTFARQHGDWPPGTPVAGQVPAGMEDLLNVAWFRRTPIGGRYLWAPDALHRGRRYRATILFSPAAGNPVANDRELFLAIDRGLDDGNLRTGKFQIGYRDLPFFSLEP
jgi:type II secretory pathway pseudopilin PulG